MSSSGRSPLPTVSERDAEQVGNRGVVRGKGGGGGGGKGVREPLLWAWGGGWGGNGGQTGGRGSVCGRKAGCEWVWGLLWWERGEWAALSPFCERGEGAGGEMGGRGSVCGREVKSNWVWGLSMVGKGGTGGP